MAITCQHCGSEAADNRVMCPSCRRRMRPAGESVGLDTATDAVAVPSAPVYEEPGGAQERSWTTWQQAGPSPVSSLPEVPVRPHVLFDRAATEEVSRLTVAFRLILAIPHLILVYLLGYLASIVGVIVWFAALFVGRVPDGLHGFMTGLTRYTARVQAYLLLLTDDYPPFSFQDRGYAVELELGAGRLNRAAVLFRLVLAIPAMLVFLALFLGVWIIAFPVWLTALITGRVPSPLFDASTVVLRYQTQFNAYFYSLTPAYPAGLFREPTERWDDAAAAQAWAAQGGPQPPRFSRGGRVVTGFILGIGVLAAIGWGIALSLVDTGSTDTALRRAHDRLIAQADDACAGQVTCPQSVTPQQQAAFNGRLFATFGEELDRIAIPADAEGARERLAAVTNRLAQVFSQLGNADTATAFSRIHDDANLDDVLAQWDILYAELETAIL